MLTTSRDPSAPLTQFVKVGPWCVYNVDGYAIVYFAGDLNVCLFDHWLCFTWLYSCRSWSLSFLMHKEWIVEARLVYFLMFQLGCHCETNMVEDMRWFMRFSLLQVISEIIETCRAHEFTDVVLVHEHRGVPDGLIICHLPFGPTAYFGLLNVVSSLISVVLYWHLLWPIFLCPNI